MTAYVETDKITIEQPKNEAELIEFIKRNTNGSNQYAVVAGAFGDMEDCDAIVEQFIYPPEGGAFTKFYGCSYLFKGVPLKQVVEGIGFAKSTISEIPREIIAKSLYIKLSLLLFALFSKKRFIHYARVYFKSALSHSIERFHFPDSRRNKLTREMNRALEVAIRREIKRKKVNDGEFYQLVRDIAKFVWMFIEYDNAYRLRLQDILENIDKGAIAKTPVKEIRRLFALLIERENKYVGIRHKWIQMRRLVIPILCFSKDARELMKQFLLELNTEITKLDEDDWYFSLRRRGYLFRGMSLDDRLKEKERIDKEKGHIILKIRKTA